MAACPSCGEENKEGARFCNACGAPLTAPAPPATEVRKTVTVLFSDVTGSTALGERHDPESMRRVMARYFEEMRAVIERHGGTVEKFIGDAVMAVFGIPQLHEDDALRAVRAGVEMRERLAALNEELERDFGTTLQVRTGINTGEVVAGSGETLATGDAVNVAARLEQAAQADEILIGKRTHRLVRDAVNAEPVDPLTLKGKTGTIQAFRLSGVVEGAEPFARRLETPLVGRTRELALLHDAYKRALEERSSHLFTVLGPAGIGKSRLAHELVALIGDDVVTLSGRCLAYGEGITYWPLIEILEQLGSEAAVAQLLEGTPEARSTVNQVFAAVGLAESPGTPEETFWAVRKLLEALAREQPLVVVLDDLQWAEPTFLDLVEHIADWSREAPILLLCLARPELLDARPGWSGGKLNATSILLEPLPEDDAGALIETLLEGADLSDETRHRIMESAEGNPLFVEQMLAMLAEEGDSRDQLAVPPTIQALLASRLDRLPADERAVIERASVIGREFWRAAAAELAPDVAEVAGPLGRLVRKELIRPMRSTVFPSEEAFRFRHQLIRDVAYAGMPKELRADLHERFADWLEARVSAFDEIVGYHLEQAWRYRSELGPLDERASRLAARAAARLGPAGHRAAARGDVPAALNLLARTVALVAADAPDRLEIVVELGRVLWMSGELDRAKAVLGDVVEQARARGDQISEARAVTYMADVDVATGDRTMDEALNGARKAQRIFEEAGDDAGLAQTWLFIGKALFWLGRSAEGTEALERALVHARRAGDRRDQSEAMTWILVALIFGPTPVDRALRRVEELLTEAHDARQAVGVALIARGALVAMRGDFDAARADVERGRGILVDLGARLSWAGTAMPAGLVDILAGEPARAEQTLREGYDALEEMGERGYLSTVAAYLANAVYLQARLEEADELSRVAEDAAVPDDFESQARWRFARARVAAARGEVETAGVLAREAVAILEPTDFSDAQADALIALAEVLGSAGKWADAAEVAERAVQVAEAKGIAPYAAKARALLEDANVHIS